MWPKWTDRQPRSPHSNELPKLRDASSRAQSSSAPGDSYRCCLCELWSSAQLTEQLSKARAAAASLQSEVSSANAEPDDDTLDTEVAELEGVVPAVEKKLAAMKGGKDAMPAAEVEALQRQFNLYLGEWKKRRKGCRELIGLVAENAAKSWKEKNFCVAPHTDHTDGAEVEDRIRSLTPCSSPSPVTVCVCVCVCVCRRTRASRRTRR